MSVQIDVLDDILNSIRLNGTVYFQKQFRGNWGIQTEATPFKKFHIIVEGECWLQAAFLEAPIQLTSGDIVAFPHGDPYQLSAALDSPCISANELMNEAEQGHALFNEGRVSASIVFGHIEFTRDFNHPFMRDLPQLIRIVAQDDDDLLRLGAVAALMVTETRLQRPGSGSVVKRLAEVLHLYTLRAHILNQQGNGSFHAAFNDPIIYQSLLIIHNNIAYDWTLDQIAKRINVSRTAFATRFRDVVGIPPMRYITLWRMQKAREFLELTNHSLLTVALSVGYGSEAAFSRAFFHEFGDTPGRYRQQYNRSS